MIQKSYASKSNPKALPHLATFIPPDRVICSCNGFRGHGKCWHVEDLAKEVGITFVQHPKPVQSSMFEEPTLSAADVLLANLFVDPMLARALSEKNTIADYYSDEWRLEEKWDGHRMIVAIRTENEQRYICAWSRAGRVRDLPPHILTDLKNNMADGVFDAELVVPGGTSTDVTALHLQSQLKLMVFDIMYATNINCMNFGLYERRLALTQASLWSPDSSVLLTPQYEVSEVTLRRIWDHGGEGAIVKNVNSVYEVGKRSKSWIKFKKEQSAELEIIGFHEGLLGPHSMILLRDTNGVEISVKSLNDEWRADFAQNADSYIGDTCVISYQEKTRDGKYRHPMADHIIRRGA